MRIVKFTIQSLEDAERGKNGIEALSGFSADEIIRPKTETISVCAMEAGMKSGKTSVALSFELDDGKPVFFELSGDMALTILKGIEAAIEKFGK